MPHYGPSSPAYPTIKKKNKERGVNYFETKGTKPSITIDLLLHHCQTITSPSSCHQCRHHHPRTKQHPTNTSKLLTLSFFLPHRRLPHIFSPSPSLVILPTSKHHLPCPKKTHSQDNHSKPKVVTLPYQPLKDKHS